VARSVSEIVIKKGKGKKLEDCANVFSQINKRPRSDELLRLVHNLFIGRVNKKVQIKANLKQFSGVTYDDDKGRERLEAKLQRQKVRDLREIARFFAIEDEGERDDLVENIIKFVEKPFQSDREPSSPKKSSPKKSSSKSSSKKSSKSSKKSGEKKKRKKKDPNAPKRPLSSYLLFCQDHRAEVKSKLGKDADVKDIAKKLGKMWSKASDEDKKKYEKKFAKAKEVYEKEKKKYESKKSSSKSSKSDSE